MTTTQTDAARSQPGIPPTRYSGRLPPEQFLALVRRHGSARPGGYKPRGALVLDPSSETQLARGVDRDVLPQSAQVDLLATIG